MLVFLASIWTPNCATKELYLVTFSLSVGHLACVRLISFRLYLRVSNSFMMSFFSSFSILQMELARDVLNPSVHVSVSGSGSSCTAEFSHVFVFSSCQCTALFTCVCVSYLWWVCKVCVITCCLLVSCFWRVCKVLIITTDSFIPCWHAHILPFWRGAFLCCTCCRGAFLCTWALRVFIWYIMGSHVFIYYFCSH